MIYRWVEDGHIHFAEAPEGSLFVCRQVKVCRQVRQHQQQLDGFKKLLCHIQRQAEICQRKSEV